MRRFDAVLFDFGGVLVTSPFHALAAAGDGALELLLGDYAVDGNHPWHRLERGEIPFQDYWDDLLLRAEAAGVVIDAAKIAGFYRRLEVHEDVVARVRSLRDEGYRTGLITNNVREFGWAWRERVPVDELFEVVVDSCEVGMRKPNPAIYRHAVGALGVPIERSVFLDDAPGNVAGAQAAGMAAILVGDDPAGALADLDMMLHDAE